MSDETYTPEDAAGGNGGGGGNGNGNGGGGGAIITELGPGLVTLTPITEDPNTIAIEFDPTADGNSQYSAQEAFINQAPEGHYIIDLSTPEKKAAFLENGITPIMNEIQTESLSGPYNKTVSEIDPEEMEPPTAE